MQTLTVYIKEKIFVLLMGQRVKFLVVVNRKKLDNACRREFKERL